jgi:hypothetical protein
MDAPSANRISSLSITRSTPRQTPDDSFGKTLTRAAQAVGRTSSELVGGLLGTSVGLSAASSGVKAATSTASLVASGAQTVGESGVPEQGGSWELLQAQSLMNQESQQFSMAYLKLQDDMQRESREHNTVSNIMKVRHDSAKAAINNIR